MSLNNRIFYACQAVAVANMGSASGSYGPSNILHGLQSVGITTNFNLEQAFELGQIEIYENIEGLPAVEVTLEKVLDGYPLIYHLASTGVTGSNASGLVARSKQRCDLRLGIYGEDFNNVAAATDNGGKPEVEVYCSGMYISSISYTLPADGNATESVTLVGNNKQWLVGNNVFISDAAVSTTNALNGLDSPLALTGGSGGIQRREDVLLVSSVLPVGITGVLGSGIGNAWAGTLGPRIHLQSVSISTDFGREDVLELGRKAPFVRTANFPIEVTCEIEAITASGDFITAIEEGNPIFNGTVTQGNNTSEETIYLQLRGGYSFDLGSKNRLSSVSYGGGDAGGGNVSCTYSYSTFNTLDVRAFNAGYTKINPYG
jgi:hypothetical protein